MPSSNETSCPKWPRMPTASSPDFISRSPLQSGPVLRIHPPLSSKRTLAYVALRQSLLASSSKPCSCGSLVWLAFSSNLFALHTSSKVELDLINSMRVFLESWALPLTMLALSSFFHLLSSVFCLVLQCPWLLHTCMFLFLNCNESSLWKVSTTFIFFPCCSVAQSCPTPCNPMDWSVPGFPVHCQIPELAQTHVHWVSGGIQPSHPLSSPSPAFNLSQQQGLFIALGGQSIGASASVLSMNGLVTKLCLTLMTPWIIVCQAPLSMGFSRHCQWIFRNNFH